MASIAFGLNDTGIVAAGAGLERWERSPGYALLDGDRIRVGRDAVSRARLKPRWVENRFWDRLDIEPLGRPFPRQLRNADLVHAHLGEIWQSAQGDRESRSGSKLEGVVLAVPGSYSNHQLGLLLGIGRACGMPIAGFVDAAVASCVTSAEAERALHVDVLLQRFVVTELERTTALARRRVESDRSSGLSGLMDRWAKLIASRFVQKTRFDPFHHGETEQSLYDKLPDWIEEIGRDDGALLTLEHRGKIQSVEISTEEMQSSVRDSYRAVVELVRAMAATGAHPALVVTRTVSGLPGLRSELESAVGSKAVVLAPGAAATGALQQRQFIVPEGHHEVSFVAELPVKSSPGQAEAVTQAPPAAPGARVETGSKPPTHLLYEGVAHPIDSDPLLLGVAIPAGTRGVSLKGPTAGVSRRHCSVRRRDGEVIVEDHSTYGSFVNGSRIEGQASLAAGDRLRLGSPGIELHLIAVE